MNWLLIVVIIIFLVSIIVGAYRGAIKIAVSLLTALITYMIVFFATPYVTKAITEFTPLDDAIKDQVSSTITNAAISQFANAAESENSMTEENVRRVLKAAGITEDTLAEYDITIEDIVSGNVSKEDLAKCGVSGSILDGLKSGNRQAAQGALEDTEIPRDVQIAAIRSADIPEVFKSLLLTNNNEEIYKQLGVETFAQYVGSYLAKLIIHIVAFLCTFLLVTIIIRAIVLALDIVADLPAVGAINHLMGAVIGIAGALIVVWTAYLLVTLLFATAVGKELFRMIEASDFLSTLYEYNPVMALATIFK